MSNSRATNTSSFTQSYYANLNSPVDDDNDSNWHAEKVVGLDDKKEGRFYKVKWARYIWQSEESLQATAHQLITEYWINCSNDVISIDDEKLLPDISISQNAEKQNGNCENDCVVLSTCPSSSNTVSLSTEKSSDLSNMSDTMAQLSIPPIVCSAKESLNELDIVCSTDPRYKNSLTETFCQTSTEIASTDNNNATDESDFPSCQSLNQDMDSDIGQVGSSALIDAGKVDSTDSPFLNSSHQRGYDDDGEERYDLHFSHSQQNNISSKESCYSKPSESYMDAAHDASIINVYSSEVSDATTTTNNEVKCFPTTNLYPSEEDKGVRSNLNFAQRGQCDIVGSNDNIDNMYHQGEDKCTGTSLDKFNFGQPDIRISNDCDPDINLYQSEPSSSHPTDELEFFESGKDVVNTSQEIEMVTNKNNMENTISANDEINFEESLDDKFIESTTLNMTPEEKKFKCDQCGKSFNRKTSLYRHLLIHTGEKPFQCDFCCKSFNQNAILKRHLLIHNEYRSFHCDLCGKTFVEKGALMRHRATHDTRKDYKCEKCGKAFILKEYLSKHMFLHSGEKPFVCDICGTSFADSSAFKRHKKIHHRLNNDQICMYCRKPFKSFSALKRHEKRCLLSTGGKAVLSEHEGTPDIPLKCYVCEVTIQSYDEYYRHMENHEKVVVKSDICGEHFLRDRKDYKHHVS